MGFLGFIGSSRCGWGQATWRLARQVAACALLAATTAQASGPGAAGASDVDGVNDATQTPIEVAPGVYALIGATGEPSPANGGVVANRGFIVGKTGTIVINTGSSYAHGKRLIATAERVGGKPVVLAILQQPIQEFVMGSAAFAERGIPVLGMRASGPLVKSRCHNCLKRLTKALGKQAMRGTRVIAPTRTISRTQTRVIAGRRLLLWHHGWGATPGDLAVIDLATGVAFSGTLVFEHRIPELRDADMAGWRSALTAFKKLPIRVLVPGYGPVTDLGAVDRLLGYFDALERLATSQLESGASLLDAVEHADLPAYTDWADYAHGQPRNLQQTYLRLEAAGVGTRR